MKSGYFVCFLCCLVSNICNLHVSFTTFIFFLEWHEDSSGYVSVQFIFMIYNGNMTKVPLFRGSCVSRVLCFKGCLFSNTYIAGFPVLHFPLVLFFQCSMF